MSNGKIVIKNVKVHNVQGVDLTLQTGQLIAFTGVSGSGKSSLAFDTIYMEGQRRYIESLSSYARRHLGSFPKPDADSISGISPTIAIEQKTTLKNPRSTVGTMTGIYDFLRVLFARLATPYCPVSLEPVFARSKQSIHEEILRMHENEKILILSPHITGKTGEFKEEFSDLLKRGYTRIRLDKTLVKLSDDLSLDGSVSHDIDIVIDRLHVLEENNTRLIEAIQNALDQGKGLLIVQKADSLEETLFSEHAYSPKSGLSYPPLEPQNFSFNHPTGMCLACQGLGLAQEFDLPKIIDPDKSLSEDCCLIASSFQTIRYGNIYAHLAKAGKASVNTPWKDLPSKVKKDFLYGFGNKWVRMHFVHPSKGSWHEYIQWKGVLHEAREKYLAAKSDVYKKKMQQYFHETVCSSCEGSRLDSYPRVARFKGKTISEITALSLREAICFLETISLSDTEKKIGEELLYKIREQLLFLDKVGLHYLSLDRTSPTLSGGEGQRVRLAAQIGAGLVGATYILDEPSIGLHPRDNHKLLQTLIGLKEKNNTVIVVEHDEETILSADEIVDVGPLAGKEGGKIVAQGTLETILQSEDSLTGKYLSGRLSFPTYKKRKASKANQITLKGASHHNLKHVSLSIPLGVFVSVTGVSGSGKSSLIIDTLYPALANLVQKSAISTGPYESLEGWEKIDKIIAIDQSPIGRTPRSNPATYIKLFDEIRDLFTLLPDSQAQGFEAGRFSFNVKEGCCSQCSGMGMTEIDMDFLEDEWQVCSLCEGKRFDENTLSVLFKGKSIHDILIMTVKDAHDFFANQPKIRSKLDLLMRVGLDYMALGQPSPTLSGGEAQRIKLAKELSRPSTGKTFYILDEPTTGLHFHDIKNLMEILHSLVDKGNTVLVIEHNMDLIKTSDWIIDIGPEAGKEGGQIVGEGDPSHIAKMSTPTGLSLKQALKKKSLIAPPLSKSHSAPLFLSIRGAKQNNLQKLDVDIPLGSITVCTGPSGSGKSSLAFETIYAEGQRRYTESLSHYARQFIKQMPAPKIDHIEGLAAAIAIEQKGHAGNPRSTVGTMTEIYDYLRILYAHIGTPFCPETGEEIRSISKEYVVKKAMEFTPSTKLIVLSPIYLHKGELFEERKKKLIKQGFSRIRLNKKIFSLEEEIPWNSKQKNELLLVIDRLVISSSSQKRLHEAIEQATSFSKNQVVLQEGEKDHAFNLAFTAPSSGKSYPAITPHTFSFNTDAGMCLDCSGLGFQYGASHVLLQDLLDLTPSDLLLLLCKENASNSSFSLLSSVLTALNIDPDEPLKNLSSDKLQLFFQGSSTLSKKVPFTWKGITPLLIQYTKSSMGNIKQILSGLLNQSECPSCQGSRLSPLARNVKIGGLSIADLCQKNVKEILPFMHALPSSPEKQKLLEEPLLQIISRLKLLEEIGLGYLSLARCAPTLSGGEAQRIRLSRQLGSGLTGCLYVLDEPTIGLHPYDNHKLNAALKKLKDLGNTLVLVEHDPLTMQIADYILDFGPGAGRLGGQITARGTLSEILKNPNSLTGAYLSGKRKIALPLTRRSSKKHILIENASLHNLKNITVSIPVGTLTCLTGVSGSGKSTLLMDVLKPEAERVLRSKKYKEPSTFIQGLDAFDKIIVLDQNPAGTTSRADISTYTELLTPLRHLYASLPEAKVRGLQPKHFSYNHRKGMCSSCWGLGTRTISLQFLPSVKVCCDSCQGQRLTPLALEVRYKEKTLGDILNLSVDQARIFFDPFPKIVKILDTLISVGLHYLTLGQEIASLSGGESQRLRLSCELAKRSTGKTLYLFDEPSIGLHSIDIEKLISIFQDLVNKGNTVILIEHHLDLIANADHLIDIGPGPGPEGGHVVCTGTPEEVALHASSKTAPFLKEHFRQ